MGEGRKAMTKQDVLRVLKQHGDFLSVSDTAKALGIKRDTVRTQILNDLEYIKLGRKKMYLASDIAQAVMERKSNG